MVKYLKERNKKTHTSKQRQQKTNRQSKMKESRNRHRATGSIKRELIRELERRLNKAIADGHIPV